VRWRQAVEEHWARLRFGSIEVAPGADATSGEGHHVFKAQVYLNGLAADAVRVELYATNDSAVPTIVTMQRGEALVGASNAHTYTASVPANRPASDFTLRIVPYHALASVPLECTRIFWHT
jgi:glycogen phosphorylase